MKFDFKKNCVFIVCFKFIFSVGFVIFYDFVLNLDFRVIVCRLIVGFYGVFV